MDFQTIVLQHRKGVVDYVEVVPAGIGQRDTRIVNCVPPLCFKQLRSFVVLQVFLLGKIPMFPMLVHFEYCVAALI